jgi:hypothetical protein
MTFHVGQKVVCVDDSLPANPWHRAYPLIKDAIYVVRGLCPNCDCGCIRIDPSQRLWDSWRFRPLEERKTDISIFTALLGPTPKVRTPDEVSA